PSLLLLTLQYGEENLINDLPSERYPAAMSRCILNISIGQQQVPSCLWKMCMRWFYHTFRKESAAHEDVLFRPCAGHGRLLGRSSQIV
ncbi:MAG: hypothetical protein ABJL67_13105, partial [Sulfitobacter sp.]